MTLSKVLQRFVDQSKIDDSYWVDHAKLDFSTALEKQRRIAGINYAGIAKKIGSSPAYISKVFRGDSNLTIESIVKLVRATGGRLEIQVVNELPATCRWDQIAGASSSKNQATDQLERIHAPLRPPPASVIREGVSYDTLMPPNAELKGRSGEAA